MGMNIFPAYLEDTGSCSFVQSHDSLFLSDAYEAIQHSIISWDSAESSPCFLESLYLQTLFDNVERE